eukprot:CAMPEP_0117442436 /NCGR_PEP_ID=MMETSP0759-20121206/4149_1 /TAXON_ID=63605 /ORGANISM="Percolomonas cosmopolitus, Strain WS" /LENGTH=214 /DNA_ID=CAMNT_0005234321 /DNA_START=646 /DNA_END=1288 /DNA_ORIENTATION=-
MTHNTPHAEIVQNIRLARKMFRGARLVTVPRPRKDPKAAAWKRQYFVFRNMKRVKQTNGKVRGEVMLTWEADPEQKVLPAAEAFHEMWVRVHRESKVENPSKSLASDSLAFQMDSATGRTIRVSHLLPLYKFHARKGNNGGDVRFLWRAHAVSRETLQLAAPAADYTQEDGAQGSDTESDSESHEDDHEDAHLMYDLKTIQTALEPINKLHRKW